jgi:sugar O-acyltransferase (sialic acid O-acetyltransferase NeuD family)
MKRKVVIYGAGGLGREVLSMLTGHGGLEAIGFLDDEKAPGTMVGGLPVMGNSSSDRLSSNSVVVAIGNPLIKHAVVQKLRARNAQFVSVIHPSVIIQSQDSVKIGDGVIIGAGTILTTDIVIGDHVLINLSCTIGHDVTIGEYSSLMPGVNIAGEVSIGTRVLIGSGVNVLNRIKIGKLAKVGMGSVVIRSVDENCTVVGVPAKPVVK